jgi:hypothetical protein
MLKPAQHDKKNYVIPNLFRNLEFANDNELIAFVLVKTNQCSGISTVKPNELCYSFPDTGVIAINISKTTKVYLLIGFLLVRN